MKLEVDIILDYFFELRDSLKILNNDYMDTQAVVKYIKQESFKIASQRGVHLTGEELQYIVSQIITYMGK